MNSKRRSAGMKNETEVGKEYRALSYHDRAGVSGRILWCHYPESEYGFYGTEDVMVFITLWISAGGWNRRWDACYIKWPECDYAEKRIRKNQCCMEWIPTAWFWGRRIVHRINFISSIIKVLSSIWYSLWQNGQYRCRTASKLAPQLLQITELMENPGGSGVEMFRKRVTSIQSPVLEIFPFFSL